MKRICCGCGAEIPADRDFCYTCGAWAKDAYLLNDDLTVIYAKTCPKCGKQLIPESQYCSYCGEKVSESGIPVRSASKTKYTNMDLLAAGLAIIPGFFNIFGLGQLVQKRWSKAFVYICTTLLLFYITPSLEATDAGSTILIFIQVGFFFFSVVDVLISIKLGRR